MSSAPPAFPPLHPAQLRLLRNRLRLSIRDAGLTDLSPAAPADTAEGADAAAAPFWALEPTPLVIPADEWTLLEAALRQRAHFVNALLVDIYTGQQVLRQNLVPPEVILSDPYFRRPCYRLEPERPSPATLLRFDLVKTAAGWAFTDTGANTPAGVGYAVQNRRFMTQEAAGLYRSLPDYHSVINFPLQLLDALRLLAPVLNRPASIVVLTAGPRDPFYSEHSFLARKMGLPLARGDDLLVLDNRVYFKTIAGLEPVDVLYRRLNDAYIDPVALSTHRETAGIPGLIQCIRAGTVVLANAIGAGVAESRALDAYLPRLMRFYLGEKPLLPSVPTYTCGDTDQLDYILDQRHHLHVEPAHARRHDDPLKTLPPPLNEHGLAEYVRENPHAFVARPHLEPLPLNPAVRKSPPFRLSAFVLCQGRRFNVFPSGLVRLGPDNTPPGHVGVTADAVVLVGSANGPGEVADREAEPVTAGAALAHTLGSRAAESLFWLGRYLERAEATARMLSILDDVALEEIPARERRRWLPVWRGLLEATGHGSAKITARASPQSALSTDLMWRMSLDAQNSSSIYSAITAAGENARELRDHVSPEAWVLLSRLLARLDRLHRQRPGAQRSGPPPPAAAIHAVLTDVNAFLGTAERTMLQDASWHFLRMGLHLERAIMTGGALRHILTALDDDALPAATSPAPATPRRDNPELSALLRMLGSQDAYRRLYQTSSQPRHVAALFLQQPEAPRSICHNLHRIKASLHAVRFDTGETDEDPAAGAVGATLEFLATLKLDRYFGAGASATDGATPKLAELLAELLKRLNALHPLLSDHYFSHQARITPAEAVG